MAHFRAMTRAAVFFCLLTMLAGPAVAQVTGLPARFRWGPSRGKPTPPSLAYERARRLDELYSRLRDASGPQQARALEAQITMVLAQSGSPTADLLMVRAQKAMQQRQADLALSLLDAVIDMYPGLC